MVHQKTLFSESLEFYKDCIFISYLPTNLSKNLYILSRCVEPWHPISSFQKPVEKGKIGVIRNKNHTERGKGPLLSPQGPGSPNSASTAPRLTSPPSVSVAVAVAGERHAAFLPHTRREAPPTQLPLPTLHGGRRLLCFPAARRNQWAARGEASP